jgi:DNA polymerase III subunit delta'
VARARAEDSEVLPEADRLEGFPHPRETALIIGQETPERTLAAAFAGGRMHHAWLITGREGIGKATLAYRLARHALANPEERDRSGASLAIAPQSAAVRQVTALSHPGLLLLRRPCDPRTRRFATSIPVDEVRRVKSFLALTGGQDAWRAVIVDSADELNVNAANALLKSLEEPPQRVLFVLVCSEPSRLLPTVRSRCRWLACSPLAGADLKRAVAAALTAAGMEVPTPEAWHRLEPLAQGSVRRALQLAASGGLELQRRIEELFAALPDVDWSAAHLLADQLAVTAQEQRFAAFYDLFLRHLARLVRTRAVAAEKAPLFALAERLIPARRLPAWAALWESALRDKNEAVRLNLDRKALLLGMLGRLEALARG